MKRYHIADLLTLSRVFFSIAIVLFAINGTSLGLTLAIFCVGEVTDALDGPFHVLYPYPRDMRYRFWREGTFPKFFDTGTDILLGVSFALYLYLRVSQIFVLWVFLPSLSIGLFVTMMIRRHPQSRDGGWIDDMDRIRHRAKLRRDDVIDDMIGIRRVLYVCAVFTLILGAIIALKIGVGWKILLILLEIVVAIVVYATKRPRSKER